MLTTFQNRRRARLIESFGGRKRVATFLSKFVKRLQRPPQRKVVVTADGFRIVFEEEEKRSVQWSRVLEVYAYVADLFSYDEVCIGFRCGSAERDVWVGEDDVGYEELLKALPAHFTNIRTDWYSQVRGPAFVANRTGMSQASLKVLSGWQHRDWFQGLVDWQG